MASWKARFMAHGFVTLFETFVALASMARSDSLHMTMLTTSLSVVKASRSGGVKSTCSSERETR